MTENVLQEADRITSQKREEDYGNAYQQATRFAQAVNACTDLNVRPEHYHIIMLCLKLVREGRRHKRDNLVDIPGYARVGEMFWEELEQEREGTDANKRAVQFSEYVDRGYVPGNQILPCDSVGTDSRADWAAGRQWYERIVVEAARAFIGFGKSAKYVATSPEAKALLNAVEVLEEFYKGDASGDFPQQPDREYLGIPMDDSHDRSWHEKDTDRLDFNSCAEEMRDE